MKTNVEESSENKFDGKDANSDQLFGTNEVNENAGRDHQVQFMTMIEYRINSNRTICFIEAIQKES